MVKKKIMTTLSVVALAGSLLSTSAFAAENNGKESLVALGDSITYGYNLGKNNDHPSKKAFPYILGEELNLRVSDLGVPGWTTIQLLAALQNNEMFQESVKHADKITIDIGSNDLLQAFADGNVTNQEVAPILNNLKSIILKVRSLTDAQIVVYNIYNPFQVTDTYRHVMGNFLLQAINPQIQAVVASLHDSEVSVADAYDAFGQNQAIYVRANDIHPTVEGQEQLAAIGYKAFIFESIKNRIFK